MNNERLCDHMLFMHSILVMRSILVQPQNQFKAIFTFLRKLFTHANLKFFLIKTWEITLKITFSKYIFLNNSKNSCSKSYKYYPLSNFLVNFLFFFNSILMLLKLIPLFYDTLKNLLISTLYFDIKSQILMYETTPQFWH